MAIFASEEVRQKNASVYAQKKRVYKGFLNACYVSVFVQLALFMPFVLEKEMGVWFYSFMGATATSIILAAIAEVFRRRAIKSAQGNW